MDAARSSSAPLTQGLSYMPPLKAMLVLRSAEIASRGGVCPDVAEDVVQGPAKKRRAGCAASSTLSAGKANSRHQQEETERELAYPRYYMECLVGTPG